MSFRNRFRHLEGSRPERDDADRRGARGDRFRSLEDARPAELCAGCGIDLGAGARHAAGCPASELAAAPPAPPAAPDAGTWVLGSAAPEKASAQATRASRLEPADRPDAHAGGGFGAEHPQWQREAPVEEAADRPGGGPVASTPPAWRGEAFPDDVAAELREKLGREPAPRPEAAGREEALAWADAQLRRRSHATDLLYAFGAFFVGRWAARRVLSAIATAILFAVLAAGGFLRTGCAAVRGDHADVGSR